MKNEAGALLRKEKEKVAWGICFAPILLFNLLWCTLRNLVELLILRPSP